MPPRRYVITVGRSVKQAEVKAERVDFVNNLLINFVLFSPLDSEAKQKNGQYEADKVFSSFHL